MVQIPRYIRVEVTGCIGMMATFGCYLHIEMEENMIPGPLLPISRAREGLVHRLERDWLKVARRELV